MGANPARSLSRAFGNWSKAVHRMWRVLLIFTVAVAVTACATEAQWDPDESVLYPSGAVWPARVSGFKPISPEQRGSSGRLVPAKVYSLQPTLRWEGFPGVDERYESSLFDILSEIQRVPFVQIDAERVENVTYDLRIWRIGSIYDPPESFDLVYEREFLPKTEHQVEEKLEPSTLYFWSIRARFEVDEQPRLSEWSMTNWPNPPGVENARDLARRLGSIPFRNYYRFEIWHKPGLTPRQIPM